MGTQTTFYNSKPVSQNFTVTVYHPDLDPNGICLIKRVSEIPVVGSLLDHYGVVVGVNLLRAFGLASHTPLILQKNEVDTTFNEQYIRGKWQIVGVAGIGEIPAIIERAKFARANPTSFDLSLRNCEQFARFIFEGIERSYQSQGWGTLAFVGLLAFLGSRDN